MKKEKEIVDLKKKLLLSRIKVLIVNSPIPIDIGISSGLKVGNNHSFGGIFVFLEQK
jgi:hypothetical protein